MEAKLTLDKFIARDSGYHVLGVCDLVRQIGEFYPDAYEAHDTCTCGLVENVTNFIVAAARAGAIAAMRIND